MERSVDIIIFFFQPHCVVFSSWLSLSLWWGRIIFWWYVKFHVSISMPVNQSVSPVRTQRYVLDHTYLDGEKSLWSPHFCSDPGDNRAYAMRCVCTLRESVTRNALGRLPGSNIQKKVTVMVRECRPRPEKLRRRGDHHTVEFTPYCDHTYTWENPKASASLSKPYGWKSNFPLLVFKCQLRDWNMFFTWENTYI